MELAIFGDIMHYRLIELGILEWQVLIMFGHINMKKEVILNTQTHNQIFIP
jgi:hypothetical protein